VDINIYFEQFAGDTDWDWKTRRKGSRVQIDLKAYDQWFRAHVHKDGIYWADAKAYNVLLYEEQRSDGPYICVGGDGCFASMPARIVTVLDEE
jgi:hypothetical protein